MAKRLIQLKIAHIAGVDRPANKKAFLIVKAEKKEGVTMFTKEQIAKMDTELQEAAIAQMKEYDELKVKLQASEEEVVKLKAAPPPAVPPVDEERWKGVPAYIRSDYEAMKKRADEADKLAKEERDKRERDTWIAKSKDYVYLPLVPEHFGGVMQKIAEHCPNEAKEIERILTSATEIIGKGELFKEKGRSGNGADGADVQARVNAMAKEFMSKDQTLNMGSAIEKVFHEHPDWYSHYVREAQVNVK